ncbi:hypothetical protein EsH8_XII_000005 [Colletotrichum jinshuiense]
MPGTVLGRKRKRAPNDAITARVTPSRVGRAAADAVGDAFREGDSVKERARLFLLSVAEMPVDVLNTTWSVGQNRPIEQDHVHEPKEMFKKGGLERRAPENRITALCSADEVHRMRAALNGRREECFLDWAAVNEGTVEVMAGQHCIKALRDYIGETGTPPTELWWTDPGLPDNHGQIWTQLLSIASKAAAVALAPTPEKDVSVNQKLVEALCLGGEKQFPTRRLVTLRNHTRWQDMTMRWCHTKLGLETFNISTFQWMASLRIDEYWVATLDAVLETLLSLPVNEGHDVGRDDWQRIAAGLHSTDRTAGDVEAVLYKGEEGQRGVRVAALLASLNDAQYDAVCLTVSATPGLAFPDLKQLLRSRKPEGQAMVRVLQHAIGWINRGSAVAIDGVNPKAKNKSLLRDHLGGALKKLSRSRGGRWPTRGCGGVTAWAHPGLHDDVALVDKSTYAERFTHVAWARLLRLVRQTTDADGQVLRPAWQTAQATRRGCCQQQASTLMQTFCARVFKLAGHSELDDPAAMIAAQRKIEDTITALILEMKGRGGSGGGGVLGAEAAGPPCSADTIPDSEGTPCSSSGQIVRQQRRSSLTGPTRRTPAAVGQHA